MSAAEAGHCFAETIMLGPAFAVKVEGKFLCGYYYWL